MDEAKNIKMSWSLTTKKELLKLHELQVHKYEVFCCKATQCNAHNGKKKKSRNCLEDGGLGKKKKVV